MFQKSYYSFYLIIVNRLSINAKFVSADRLNYFTGNGVQEKLDFCGNLRKIQLKQRGYGPGCLFVEMKIQEQK